MASTYYIVCFKKCYETTFIEFISSEDVFVFVAVW
jgi:hypothetical protein